MREASLPAVSRAAKETERERCSCHTWTAEEICIFANDMEIYMQIIGRGCPGCSLCSL